MWCYYYGMSEALTRERADELSFEASRVFTPAAPIDDRALFAGRRTQVRQVIDAINQKGQHAIIFGDRGVGKTSLANVLASFLPAGGVVMSRRINCDKGDSYNSVWQKVFSEIQPQDVAQVGGFAGVGQSPRVDATADIISPDVVRRQLMRWSSTSIPILIIDEFDRVDDAYRSIFADTIKTLSDHAVPATVILVGVADSVDQLIAEHESIQRALVQIKMPRMSKDEIKEIIVKGLSRLGMGAHVDALDRIVVLAQGLPHYAHLLGLHASRAALDGMSLHVDIPLLDIAIRKAIEAAQQSIRSAWHKAIVSARKDNLFADVMLSCALAKTDDMGTFAAQDVRTPMQIVTGKPYEIPTFAQHLNEFSDPKRGNILKKMGESRRFRYRFTNPLMPPFVIMRGFADGKVTSSLLKKIAESAAGDSKALNA
jgi:Cdc6-like AAA superfamily ATPase